MQKNKSEDVRAGEIFRSNTQRASHAGFLKPFFIIFMSALSLAAAGFACGGGEKASDPVAEDAGLIEDAGEENTCERTEPGDICCGNERCAVGHECGESGSCEEIHPALLAEAQGGAAAIHEDGSDSLTVHVSLSHNPRAGDVKVFWQADRDLWREGDSVVCLTADGADGDAAENHGVVLNADNWQTGFDVTCRYSAEGTDTFVRPDRQFAVNFSTQSDDNTAFSGLTASPSGLTLKDSDEAKVIVTVPDDLTTTEDGGSVQIRVRLASQPPPNSDRLYLKISAANDDGTQTPYGLPDKEQIALFADYRCGEFPEECWKQDQVINVTGQDDHIVNASAHTYTLTLGLRDEDVESCRSEESTDPWCGLEPTVIHLVNADNESPNIVTDVTTFQVSESGTTARVGVKLSTQPIAPVTMTASIEPVTECALAGANGAASATATLNFPADNTFDTYQYITVVGVNDSADDGNAACTLTLTASSDDSAPETGYNGKTLTLTGQNEDNDTAGILGMTPSQSIIAETSGHGSSTSGTMRLSLATEPEADVRIQMSSQNVNAADTTRHVSFSPFSLTFTPDNYSTPQTVTYTAIDDHKVNATSSMQVTLLATPSSTDAKYNGDAAGATAQVTVKDTTYASLSVGSASTMRLSEATASSSPATIAVKLKSIPTAPVTFTVTSSDASRLKVGLSSSISAAAGSVNRTIQPGSWSNEVTVYAFAVDDNAKNAVNTAYLRFSWTSEDSNYNKGTTITTQDFTIVDNDTADFVVGTPSPATLYESSASSGASIKLSLTSKPTAQVNFTAASSDPERLKVSLTNSSSGASDSVKTGISPDSWQSGVTIYAFAVNDSIGNTNNTAKVTFTTTSRDSNFTGKSGETSNITIVDNDSIEQKTLTVSCGSVTAPCVPSGHTTGSCTVSLNSSNRPTNAQSVSVTCTSDVVWSSGDSFGPKTISSSNNWSTSITGLVSRCCGASVDGTDNKSGTVTCTATGTGFSATGRGSISIRSHNKGDCEWLY